MHEVSEEGPDAETISEGGHRETVRVRFTDQCWSCWGSLVMFIFHVLSVIAP